LDVTVKFKFKESLK